MRLLDKFKLKLKNKNLGKLTWDLLKYYSVALLGVFFLITSITFWLNQSILFPELSIKINQMIFMVLIAVLIISIEGIRGIFRK